jgi:hypothetical protein
MQVIVKHGMKEEYAFSNLKEFDLFWIQLTKELFEQNMMIHFVKIDEQTFYEGYEQIIAANFAEIETLFIETITYSDAFEETLSEIRAYKEKLVAAADHVASPFYSDPNEDDWKNFTQYLEGLHWLYQACDFCLTLNGKINSSSNKELTKEIDRTKSKIFEDLKELERALTQQQYTEVADYILFEITPHLETTMITKGHDVNA